MKKFLAYYRVSSKKQNRLNSWGLKAQKDTVAQYLASCGGKLIGEYQEVESGKRNSRPQLQAALSHARGKKATLVIACLSRLARNVAFTAALMESGVDFVCCDIPNANRLTIHILAAVAEDEALAISCRTKNSLAVARQRGVKLGTARPGHYIDWQLGQRRGLSKAVAAASAKRSQQAADAYGFLLTDMRAWREAGESLASIAERLNADGHRMTNGREFHPVAVYRILLRPSL